MQINRDTFKTGSTIDSLDVISGPIVDGMTAATTLESLEKIFGQVYPGHTLADSDEYFKSHVVTKAVSMCNIPVIKHFLRDASPQVLKNCSNSSYLCALIDAENPSRAMQYQVAKVLSAYPMDLARSIWDEDTGIKGKDTDQANPHQDTVLESLCLGSGHAHLLYLVMAKGLVSDEAKTSLRERPGTVATLRLAEKVDNFLHFIMASKHSPLVSILPRDALLEIADRFLKITLYAKAEFLATQRTDLDLDLY